jgi:hypothetical protein
MKFAVILDGMILLRTVLAVIIKQRDKGWIFYAVLPWAIIPLIEAIARILVATAH